MRKRYLYLIVTIVIIWILSSCNDISAPNNEVDNYFPFADNYNWTYEKTYNENVINDTVFGNTIIDTVVFCASISDTINNVPHFIFNKESLYEIHLFREDNCYYSTEHPQNEEGPYLYWSNDFSINDTWIYWAYGQVAERPHLLFPINNEVVALDSSIIVNNQNYSNCIVIKRNYINLAGHEEMWFYAEDVGLVLIQGTKSLLSRTDTYEYKIIDYIF